MTDENMYHYLKYTLKERLIKDLKKDEDFKDLKIEDLIEERVNIILDNQMELENVDIIQKNNDNNEMNMIKEYIKLNKSIKFQEENPKSKGTVVYDRYERYKRSSNYKEFIELGGKNDDYYYDYRKGFFKIID